MGVVKRSLLESDGGPLQRAIPGSTYSFLIHAENQARLQSQYNGFRPKALFKELILHLDLDIF